MSLWRGLFGRGDGDTGPAVRTDGGRDSDSDTPCAECIVPAADEWTVGFRDDELLLSANCADCSATYTRRYDYRITEVDIDGETGSVDERTGDAWMYGRGATITNPLSWANRPTYEYVPGPAGYTAADRDRVPGLSDYPTTHRVVATLDVDAIVSDETLRVRIVEADEVGVATFDRIGVGPGEIAMVRRMVGEYLLVELAGDPLGRAEFPREGVATDADLVSVVPLFHPVALADGKSLGVIPITDDAAATIREAYETNGESVTG